MTEQNFQELIAEVNGRNVTFLVDTGANLSLLNFDEFEKSNETVIIKGVTGKEEKFMTKPLPVTISDRHTWARFVVSPGSPVSLLGRDILQDLGTQIALGKKGIHLVFIESAVVVQKEPTKPPVVPWELRNVPMGLWSKSSKDVGFLKSAVPVKIKTKGGIPPAIRQYPIVTEAIPSIRKQIQEFLNQGVLRPTISPFNTPILPVNKNRVDEDGNPEYRFVQDLRAINEYVEPPHPVVPDPSTILTKIPNWANQNLFAFTWEGRQYTWTRLPQGFTASPTLFSQILKQDLQDLELPAKSILIQYVDDLLIASLTFEDCVKDTEYCEGKRDVSST
uniref:ribonuclease H n=1 Tax=Falco tinnunculus TaxID=100819 RepID=A0A8C4UPD9_FALTI